MAKNNITSPDTLSARLDTLRTGIKSGILEYLGKPLYSILETQDIKYDMPFGFKSKYDIRDESFNLRKQWGKEKDWQLDLMLGKDKGRLNIKKKF
jgi:hypothetical protein